jgi:TetR/AcrR family fatty acid metabolism transcriptional regulator
MADGDESLKNRAKVEGRQKVGEGDGDKRSRILDGALRAFAKKGFYNTKVSEIADEADVADGTIYLYFQNKDDLLISLFEDKMEWVIERIRDEMANVEGDVLEKVRRFVELHFQLAIENPELAEFITVELRQSAKFVKEYDNPKFQDYLGMLQHLIEEGQSEGIFAEELESRLMSRALFGALDQVLLELTLTQKAPEDVSEEVDQVTRMLVDGLRAST